MIKNKKSILFIVGLFLPLVFWYVYYTLQYPYFSFSDEHQIIDYFLKNIYPVNIFPEIGRYTPLFLTEYYPIASSALAIDDKMFFMYVVNAIKSILYLFGIFILINKVIQKNTNKEMIISFIATTFFLIASIKYSFINMANCIIFPEITLTLLVLSYLYLY